MRTFAVILAAMVAVAVAGSTALAGDAPQPSLNLGARTIVTTSNGVTTTTRVGAAQVVSPSIAPKTIACPNGTVYGRAWSQDANSYLYGVFWSNQHRGYYYFGCGGYDGRTHYSPSVWQTSQFGWDNAGYHKCESAGTGRGFTVSGLGCWKTGDPSQYPNQLHDFDNFKVSVVVKQLPFSATYTMCFGADPYGNVYNCT